MKLASIAALRAIGFLVTPDSRADAIRHAIKEQLDASVDPTQGDQPRHIHDTFAGGLCSLEEGAVYELILRPAGAADFGAPWSTACEEPTEDEWAGWRATAEEINGDLVEHGLRIRLVLQQDAAKRPGACSSDVAIMSCSSLKSEETTENTAGLYGGSAIAIRRENDTPTTLTHELGHALGLTHPHAATSMGDLQRQVAEFECEGTLFTRSGSVMRYDALCEQGGLLFGLGESPTSFGPVDLCALRKATLAPEQWEAVRGDCEGGLVDLIAAHTGTRVAGFFAASIAGKLVERALIQSILRNTADGPCRKNSLRVASLLGTVVRAVVLGAFLGSMRNSAALVAGASTLVMGLCRSGAFGRAIGAVAGAIHEANLFVALFGAGRGSIWGTPGLVASVAGNTAGSAVATIFDAIASRCAPPTEQARSAIATHFAPTSPPPLVAEKCARPATEAIRSSGACGAKALDWIARFDRAIAKGIDRYLMLNGLVSWIHASDQARHDGGRDLDAVIEAAMRDAAQVELGEAGPQADEAVQSDAPVAIHLDAAAGASGPSSA